MRRAVATLLSITTALACLEPGALHAQSTRACEQRALAIAAAQGDDARRTRVWYWSWMAAGTALIAGQTVLAALTSGDAQKDAIVGASASVFIPAFLLVHPPAVLSDAPRLEARFAQTTVDGRLGDPCESLLRARDLLDRDADDERFAKAWFAHAFVIGGNIALGLLLGVAFGDWLGFAKQAVGGSLVGELQIWTLPAGAVEVRGMGFGAAF